MDQREIEAFVPLLVNSYWYFDFTNEFHELKINKVEILVSYDVSSLFTNVPLDETAIEILFEQLVQYNAQSCPYRNGSCRSPKRSHQRTTIPVWRSSLRTGRWRCYGVPSRALISKRLHSNHWRYPWASRKTSILLPSICWWHAHCNAWFSNSNYFPVYPQQGTHLGQIHYGVVKERQASFPWHWTTQPFTLDWDQDLCKTNKHGCTFTLPNMTRWKTRAL